MAGAAQWIGIAQVRAAKRCGRALMVQLWSVVGREEPGRVGMGRLSSDCGQGGSLSLMLKVN